MKRSKFFDKVPSRYLFQEIKQRVNEFRKNVPDASIISLGIGDTTEPLTSHITQSLVEASTSLGKASGYVGYGPEQGYQDLREAISEKIYNSLAAADDIFISDGAKCDIGRLQLLFGPEARIALQDPAYPVYLDTSLLFRGGSPILLKCHPENDFQPDLTPAKEADVLFLCLPNNPTGTVFSHKQLEAVVRFAKEHKILIIFDTAYSFFVQKGFPRSIYEIDGADEVAIEMGSFSKIAGFSGVRLSWAVIPEKLKYSSGEPIKPDWKRINSTFFNGASCLSQKGGLAALSERGLEEINQQVKFYAENTTLLRSAFLNLGVEVHGGIHSPYLWVHFPSMNSWQAFDLFLKSAHIVTTPGSGFGPAGDHFLRISGFASRANILEAVQRIKKIVFK